MKNVKDKTKEWCWIYVIVLVLILIFAVGIYFSIKCFCSGSYWFGAIILLAVIIILGFVLAQSHERVRYVFVGSVLILIIFRILTCVMGW